MRASAPTIAKSCRIAPNAVICGDVTIGENCSVGFGCVLTAEERPDPHRRRLRDHGHGRAARAYGTRRSPSATRVLIGPRAYLVGCTVEDNVFLATGATVFNGARIGKGAEVRINGLVHLKTVLPPGRDGCRSAGSQSATRRRSCRRTSISESGKSRRPLDFPRVRVRCRPPRRPGESIMPTVMPRYARRLGNAPRGTNSSPGRSDVGTLSARPGRRPSRRSYFTSAEIG